MIVPSGMFKSDINAAEILGSGLDFVIGKEEAEDESERDIVISSGTLPRLVLETISFAF